MTQQYKILNALSLKMWVANYELNYICFRYSSRICEMRKKMIDIIKKQEDGIWYYSLATPRRKIDFVKCCLKEDTP